MYRSTEAYNHVYLWGNNPKRARLKGKACRVVAQGRMNSIMVEFENGQREITSRYAIRESGAMAFKRQYKKTATPFKSQTQPAAPAAKSRFAPKEKEAEAERRPYGGGYKGKPGGDGGFIGITGMFPTKKGGSYQVFIKPEHLEILQSLEAGDSLGVTPGELKDGREVVRLWARKADQ